MSCAGKFSYGFVGWKAKGESAVDQKERDSTRFPPFLFSVAEVLPLSLSLYVRARPLAVVRFVSFGLDSRAGRESDSGETSVVRIKADKYLKESRQAYARVRG